MDWTLTAQVGDLPAAIAYFHSKLPGWWFSVGACHVSADASAAADTAGSDAWLYRTGDREVTKWFDEGFHADLHPPATMADALIRVTDLASAARDAYCAKGSLEAALAAYNRVLDAGLPTAEDVRGILAPIGPNAFNPETELSARYGQPLGWDR
jgi:hypothetical protein